MFNNDNVIFCIVIFKFIIYIINFVFFNIIFLNIEFSVEKCGIEFVIDWWIIFIFIIFFKWIMVLNIVLFCINNFDKENLLILCFIN